jgi:hypothetical protein
MIDPIEIVKLALQYGLPGVLLLILVLIVMKPTRAEELKALILQPTFRFFRWGSKQYLGAKVGGTVTDFLRHYLSRALPHVVSPQVQIRWVSSAADPIFSEDGSLILCLEDTNDQTRNILTATRVALPLLVCSTVRSRISRPVQSAIDLTLLQRLAENLGRHAKPLFQRYFLEPELEAEERVAELFRKLVELDSKGIFVFIFLEELNLLGERCYREADLTDKTGEVERFLEFLLRVARRDLGQEIELEYVSREFKVGIVMVAKTAKAQAQGIVPYLKAIDYEIAHDCESIYLMGFQPSATIFARLMDALDADQRVAVEKRRRTRITPDMKSNLSDHLELALVRVIRFLSDATFQERVAASGITEGLVTNAHVLDQVEDRCIVDVRGLRCTLRRSECSWRHVDSCSDVVSIHDQLKILVKKIDAERSEIDVTLRLPEDDPWRHVQPPESGDIVEIEITGRAGNKFFGLYKKTIEITVPVEEMSWLGAEAVNTDEFIGATERVLVIGKDDEQHVITASLRLTQENPWPQIHKRYPKNTRLRGVVCDVNGQYVLVKLEDGLVGHIPRESMVKAGYEFADYEESVVVGQGLDVVVTKIFLEKKKIRLDLERNLAATQAAKR